MAKISANQLASYAVDQLEAGSDFQLVARKLAAYLLENRQSRDLSKVLRAVEAEANRRGSTQVTITSAHAVSEAVMIELAALLNAENPVFHEVIDANVIGGVKASAGEAEIDLTVRGKLNRFKTSIANSK
jgi:F0F1-type ATP synthase delta subunit